MKKTELNEYRFISFTECGETLMMKAALSLWEDMAKREGDEPTSEVCDDLHRWTNENFAKGNILVFTGAAGIAVRAIAPYIKDKAEDPAVIVMDEKGENVIPILSGHLGGGVEAARRLALLVGGKPVITTATDVEGVFAVDVYAKKNDLAISDMKAAKEFTATLITNKEATYSIDDRYSEYIDVCPPGNGIVPAADGEQADLIFSPASAVPERLSLIPGCIVLGMGCRKGVSGQKLLGFVREHLNELGIDIRAVRTIVSADLKRDEEGLKELAGYLGAEFVTFSAEVLMSQKGEFESSDFVRSVTGTDNVCERAITAYGCSRILSGKQAKDGMTLAVGIQRTQIGEKKLYVVGIGPGNYENMTLRAVRALEDSDCIAGYTVYCDLVRPHFPEKEYIETPMMGEEKRAELALEKAAKGHRVSLICSGDAGVYGLACLAVERSLEYQKVSIEVIPGVTAALSGAALLGAPLTHDFALISLSDRLTPIEDIEKRLKSAAESNLAIVIYNPESRSRSGYLARACELLLEYIEPERVCGIVRNIGRSGQSVKVMSLKEMRNAEADMFSTVFIGNKATHRAGGFMVTPRGYTSER